MVALEEGLLDLDAEVRDGFTLRHLLSHCAGLPTPGARWREPPGYPPGTQRWYSNGGYVQAARLLEGASGMSCADYLREAVLAPLGMDASLGLSEADARSDCARLAAGALRRGRAVQLAAVPQRCAAAGRGVRDGASLRGVPLVPARRRRAQRPRAAAGETVDELLAPQFGPLPGGVDGVGEWPDLCWGLGFDVRGRRPAALVGRRR